MKHILALIVIVALAFSASAADFKAQPLVKNNTITLAASTTTNLPAATHGAAGLFIRPDGATANVSLMVSVVGTNANATNTVALTLYTVPDGVNTSTSDLNKFTLTVNGNGTTAATVVTNISTAVLHGAKAIRVTSIVTGSSAASGGALTITPKLTGFVP